MDESRLGSTGCCSWFVVGTFSEGFAGPIPSTAKFIWSIITSGFSLEISAILVIDTGGGPKTTGLSGLTINLIFDFGTFQCCTCTTIPFTISLAICGKLNLLTLALLGESELNGSHRKTDEEYHEGKISHLKNKIN